MNCNKIIDMKKVSLVLGIFIMTLLSCEKDDAPQCDCKWVSRYSDWVEGERKYYIYDTDYCNTEGVPSPVNATLVCNGDWDNDIYEQH